MKLEINLSVIPTHDLEVYLQRCETLKTYPEHYELVKRELENRKLR